MKKLIVSLAVISCFSMPASADETRINLYGASYHPDKAAAAKYKTDNEFNPGLAINRTFNNNVFVEAGFYEDSGRNTAKFANVGYYHPFFNKKLLVGGALTLIQSDTYNQGKAFVAPIPSIALDFKKIRVHMVWFPKVTGFNEVEAFGFYVSTPLPH